MQKKKRAKGLQGWEVEFASEASRSQVKFFILCWLLVISPWLYLRNQQWNENTVYEKIEGCEQCTQNHLKYNNISQKISLILNISNKCKLNSTENHSMSAFSLPTIQYMYMYTKIFAKHPLSSLTTVHSLIKICQHVQLVLIAIWSAALHSTL